MIVIVLGGGDVAMAAMRTEAGTEPCLESSSRTICCYRVVVVGCSSGASGCRLAWIIFVKGTAKKAFATTWSSDLAKVLQRN